MFEAFVLAGGSSSRMGNDKALLELNGSSLAETVAETLRSAGSSKVSMVASEELAKSQRFGNLHVLADVLPHRGPPGGLHTALAFCNEPYAAVVACDMPLISREFVELLVKTLIGERQACVAPVQSDGRVQPLCGVYDVRECAPRVASELEKENGTLSALDLIYRLDPRLLRFDEYASLPNARHLLLNVNTRADLETARNLATGF